jgi:hypothetical protein
MSDRAKDGIRVVGEPPDGYRRSFASTIRSLRLGKAVLAGLTAKAIDWTCFIQTIGYDVIGRSCPAKHSTARAMESPTVC